MKKIWHVIILVLLFLLGVTALQGGLMLALDPSGNSIQLPSQWITNTIFGNYFIPGLALLSILGIGSLVIAVLVIKKYKYGYLMTAAQGSAVLFWLFVQIISIGQYFFLQTVYAVIGLMLFYGGWRLHRQAITTNHN